MKTKQTNATKMTKKQQKQLAKLDLLRSFYDENVDPFVLLRVAFIKDQEELLGMLNHKQMVQWAYQCAESVQYLIDNEEFKTKANECLSLIKKWIRFSNDDEKNNNKKQEKSVVINEKRKQLKTVLNIFSASYTSIASALNASYAALYASEAVIYASHIALDASCAAQSASDAAHYAFCTAELVSNAARNASNVVINQQQQEAMNLRFLIEIAINNQ